MADTEGVRIANRFSVSESGTIGISGHESLSVMYPDIDRAPVILSKGSKYLYLSAVFMKFRGKEHLAAGCWGDGCLHLWDIESKTYRQVFDPKLPKDKRFKGMIICKIDESTIAYGEVYPSLDESRSVFILKTDTEGEWTVSGTLKLFTPDIWDMCHTEMADRTSCLLLCLPYDTSIMAVEMEEGKTRWKVGEEQMGEAFHPWSICSDQDNCAYVADFGQKKIHLFSASDGTVIKRFDLLNFYGIDNAFTVRFHDQHLYVEHKVTKYGTKYKILKFKQIKTM